MSDIEAQEWLNAPMGKMKKPMSDKQYAIKYQGKVCPNCKSKRTQCYHFPTHSMECLNCYAIWEEMYMLCGYRNLEVKEEKKNEI